MPGGGAKGAESRRRGLSAPLRLRRIPPEDIFGPMKPEDARPVSGRGEATTQAASRARDSGPQQQCTKRRAPAEAPSPGAGGTGERRQISRISRRGVRAPVTSLSARPSPLAPQRRPRRRRGPPFPLPLPSGNRVGAGDEHKACGGAGGRSAPAAIRPSRSGGLVVRRKRRHRCLPCPVVGADECTAERRRRWQPVSATVLAAAMAAEMDTTAMGSATRCGVSAKPSSPANRESF